jgi:uncharacterized membrane protein YdbT with pleckstrin-like domain
MTDDWLRLDPEESVEWETHPRLMRAAPGVVVGLVIAVIAVSGGLAADARLLATVVLAPLPAAYAYLRVVNTRYVVTDRALYRKQGVVGIDLRSVEQRRVQNTRATQGVLGTLFGYGTVEIEVAGGADLRFADVYDPNDVRRLVDELAGGGRSVPGTIEQWRAVRDELRAVRRAMERQPK